MSSSAPSLKYFPTLDGWRAVAILAVLLSHWDFMLKRLGWTTGPLLSVLKSGRLGVDLFFAISGFLICSRLLQEREQTGRISLRDFYLRRAFRILPLYYAYLGTISLLAVAAQLPVSFEEVLSSAFFVRNYAIPSEGGYTNHFWSLAVEEHFYILWPVWLVLLGPRRALLLTPLWALGIHCWRALDSRYGLFAAHVCNLGVLQRTDTRIDALLWGCLAALVYQSRPGLRFPWWSAWVCLFLLVAIVSLSVPAQPLWLALLFPVLVLSTVTCADSRLGRFLERPSIRWLGRLSYSLYVWQTLFLQESVSPDPAWLVFLKRPPLNHVMILACAVGCHYVLEQPMIRLGRKVQRALDGKHFSVARGAIPTPPSGGEPGPKDEALAPTS